VSRTPSPPFHLRCGWCPFYIVVNARGMHLADPGAGVAAAELMRDHIQSAHGRTWGEYIAGNSARRGGAA
jgi:hypothetical protein